MTFKIQEYDRTGNEFYFLEVTYETFMVNCYSTWLAKTYELVYVIYLALNELEIRYYGYESVINS